MPAYEELIADAVGKTVLVVQGTPAYDRYNDAFGEYGDDYDDWIDRRRFSDESELYDDRTLEADRLDELDRLFDRDYFIEPPSYEFDESDLMEERALWDAYYDSCLPSQSSREQIGHRKAAQMTVPEAYNFSFKENRPVFNTKKYPRKKFRAKHWRRDDWVLTEDDSDDPVVSVLDEGDEEFVALCQMGFADVAIALNY